MERGRQPTIPRHAVPAQLSYWRGGVPGFMEINLNPIPHYLALEKKNIVLSTAHRRTRTYCYNRFPFSDSFYCNYQETVPEGHELCTPDTETDRSPVHNSWCSLGEQVSLIKSTETRPNSGLRWFRYVGVELQARDPLSSDRNHLRDLRDWAHTQELVLITSWLYIVCILTGFFRADHSIFLITCKPLSPFPSRLNPQPPSPNSCSTNS